MDLPDLGFKKVRGLGDTVENIIRAVGIKKKGCSGCAKRKALLNKLVPYGKSDENSNS